MEITSKREKISFSPAHPVTKKRLENRGKFRKATGEFQHKTEENGLSGKCEQKFSISDFWYGFRRSFSPF